MLSTGKMQHDQLESKAFEMLKESLVVETLSSKEEYPEPELNNVSSKSLSGLLNKVW